MKLLIYVALCTTIACAQNVEVWQSLAPAERVMSLYLFRAALPGNEILFDQHHRHASTIAAILEIVLMRREVLQAVDATLPDIFFDHLKAYLLRLWVNHGQYALREPGMPKYTPATLGLNELTAQRLEHALRLLGDERSQEHVGIIYRALFDAEYELVLVTPGSIEQSAVNLYAPGMTDADYQELPVQDKERITAYCSVAYDFRGKQVTIEPYSIMSRYQEQLKSSLYWISKAHQHAQQFPELFDTHCTKSLELLIAYLISGLDSHLRAAQLHAHLSTSRLHYSWGFIPSNKDPKGTRGFFGASIAAGVTELFACGQGASQELYPIFEAVIDPDTGSLVDAELVWPADMAEQQWYWTRHAGVVN
jgi:hypothetical protein